MSDVDLAGEIVQKETDSDRARNNNYDRVEELAASGQRFRNMLEISACWHLEVFKLFKGRSRVIALADYVAEKSFRLGGTAPISDWKARAEAAALYSEHTNTSACRDFGQAHHRMRAGADR